MHDRHKNRRGHNKIDLTNRRFGKLKVLFDTGRRKTRRPIWKCLCDCGKEAEVLAKYLINGDTKSCGCFNTGNAYNRTGYKDVSGSYWYIVVAQAKRRGIPITITAEEAYNQFVKQDRKCALSQTPITLVKNLRDEREKQTASLDRIENAKGYTIDNIQWVHKKVNIMRNTMSIPEFKEWCRKIS